MSVRVPTLTTATTEENLLQQNIIRQNINYHHINRLFMLGCMSNETLRYSRRSMRKKYRASWTI
eukprot:scaffold17951_cov117-Skeletonema_dohrnii-CCMP3373.AAC.1